MRYQIIFTLVILLTAAGPAFSQCEKEPKILTVRVATPSQLVVTFDNNTNWTTTHSGIRGAATDPTNWTIVSPSLLLIAKAEGNQAVKATKLAAAMPDISAPITESGTHALIINLTNPLPHSVNFNINVNYDGTVIAKDCMSPPFVFVVPDPNVAGAGGAGATKTKIVLEPIPKREDSDIYIEGTIEGASGEKSAFTIDASFGKRFKFSPNNEDNTWKPFFDIKASTNEDADPDSLAFGVEFQQATKIDSKPLGITDIFFRETPKFEADRNFRNVNLVGDFRMHFISDNLAGTIGRVSYDIVPFFGIELGKNLKSPVDEADGNGIARPLIGANLFANLYTWSAGQNEYAKALTFETLYERRWPLTGEVALDDDDDGNPVGLQISRKPHDYVKSSLTFDFARNFGFKASYEYGSLPPLFKLVDHKFSLGLVFKGVFARKNK